MTDLNGHIPVWSKILRWNFIGSGPEHWLSLYILKASWLLCVWNFLPDILAIRKRLYNTLKCQQMCLKLKFEIFETVFLDLNSPWSSASSGKWISSFWFDSKIFPDRILIWIWIWIDFVGQRIAWKWLFRGSNAGLKYPRCVDLRLSLSLSLSLSLPTSHTFIISGYFLFST